MFYCPRCGEETERLFEGYCEPCCEQGQQELDEHNARYDWWESLTEQQRQAQIRDAIRRG